ncbi:expressed protein [Chlorella variabilis]|uniref:Expressed protein n=1 Tax=Chlorella variabilis TaxID=554065 RepID=E1ZRY3_CHLVA|nr:expressed protein [Chlorella variabilis]EFN51418.1 expressed protein [Chlorella variabilis]|eukprot:XP_005843520.1 expressed protein [Chlorella variabilis]
MAAQPEPSKVGRHLLRHELTDHVRAAAAAELGCDATAAGHALWQLRKQALRDTFERVYGVPTASGNNDWLRGKLLQGGAWRLMGRGTVAV